MGRIQKVMVAMENAKEVEEAKAQVRYAHAGLCVSLTFVPSFHTPVVGDNIAFPDSHQLLGTISIMGCLLALDNPVGMFISGVNLFTFWSGLIVKFNDDCLDAPKVYKQNLKENLEILYYQFTNRKIVSI
ncbi:predicted protein [Postia placenta Mad-698-R]|nr:predicted protein [Postia placenta Mad-698-R]